MNKRKHIITIAAVLAAVSMNMTAQPAQRTLWNDGWTFTKDGESRVLDLPHDWGVDGPFVQEYPGETGKLAWWGKAEYSKILSVTAKDLRSGKRFLLDFGGAMSYAKVFCNGKAVTEWPYGYASFRADLTPFVQGRGQSGQGHAGRIPGVQQMVSRRRNLPERVPDEGRPRWRGAVGDVRLDERK